MIKIIYGKKGTGKTKRIIDMANGSLETCDGSIIYIFLNNRYMYDLRHQIRFIDSSDYEINGAYNFLGFISGLAASDFDLKLIFVDGFLKHMDRNIDELEELFVKLDHITKKRNIDLVLSVSADKEELPEFLLKYLQ